ncbi:MAG TPA: hypothetical protein VFQ61_15770 [Polyangiaceae bacterium]|nr:hypothetical protein [Polyangiaceae bacterium]
MSEHEPLEPFPSFRRMLSAAGLGRVSAFDVAWFNDLAPPEERLPDFERGSALAFLIGNGRELWPEFCARLCADSALRCSENPLDEYVVGAVERAVQAWADRTEVLFAHTLEPRPIPIQRIAQAAGFAHLSPSHLSVHAEFGPWFALRAVVVIDRKPENLQRRPAPDPCSSCRKPCLPLFREAEQKLSETRTVLHTDESLWRAFLAVREACPIGRDARYDEAQIDYHYSKRLDRLLRLLAV